MKISPLALEALVASTGSAYLGARDALLAELSAEGRSAIAGLAAGPGWRERLTARILSSWADDRARCEAVGPRMRGDPAVMGRPPPLVGRWTGTERGRAVGALGPRAAPRVLEILWKTGEAGDDTALESLFSALSSWDDADADPVLLDLLDRGARYARCLAADRLGQRGVLAAGPPLLAALTDRASGDALRGCAATALARLAPPAPLVVEAMRVILASARESSALKAETSSALARLDPEAAAAALNQRVILVDDDALRCAMMGELATIGDRQSLDVLDRLAAEHPRAYVREEAEKAAQALRARLG